MDSQLEPPTKRFRASTNGKIQLTECIREFKLPRQYPSMVSKIQTETIIEKKNNQIFAKLVSDSASASISNSSVSSKIIQSKELASSSSKIRTIKLKGKDGRDLGLVNIQNLPQNIKGKTITLAKNNFNKLPEAITVTNDNKGVTIGVLIPVNVIESGKITRPMRENKMINDKSREKNIVKGGSASYKKNSAGQDFQDKTKVLVLQSGKALHRVNIQNIGQNYQTARLNLIGKTKQIKNGENDSFSVNKSYEEKQVRNTRAANHFCIAANKSAVRNHEKLNMGDSNRTAVKILSQIRTIDSTTTANKSASLAKLTNGKTINAKLDVSKIVGNSVNNVQAIKKNETFIKKSQNNINNNNVIMEEDIKPPVDLDFIKKSTASDIPTISRTLVESTSGNCHDIAWRKKLLASNKNDPVKYPSSSTSATSFKQSEKKIVIDDKKKKNLTNNLSILEKALNTVEDGVLREKALKALAECGIGIERLVPVRPASERKPVKDSGTQTSIFGLWDEENDNFIYVAKDSPTIERIPITLRKQTDSSKNITPVPNFQDLYLNGTGMFNWSSTESRESTNLVKGYVKDNEASNKIAAIFEKPISKRTNVFHRLEKDYAECTNYNDNGFLSIHEAVVNDQTQAVIRLLMVLRACNKSIDVATRNGQTSLELAILHNASPKIVKLLLDAGAEPTSTNTGHDSALLIASRHSNAILMKLISYVKSCKWLDNYDSEGFAALHHCARNGFLDGAADLIRRSADINLRDRRSGRTSLFHAIENQHNNIAEMLIENGAEAVIPNYGGQTIFNIIDENKHHNLVEILHRAKK